MAGQLETRPDKDWPSPLPGFEHIYRFWDTWHDRCSSKIMPGEYYVSNKDEIISTVLGSCISVCIRDPGVGVGGMNHFMLPGGADGGDAMVGASAKLGVFAMEYLINSILKQGGVKANFEVKLFGGANVLATGTDIGDNNVSFIRKYASMEGLKVVSEDLGGIHPRKLNYFPVTGKVMMKHLRPVQEQMIAEREKSYFADVKSEPAATGDVELF